MTVIAIKNGIIAADSQLTVDDSLKLSCEKLFRVRDGVIGFVGATAPGNELLHHLRKAHCTDPLPLKSEGYAREDFGALLLTRHGVYLYDNSLSPDRVTGAFFALGTGAPFALAAMHCGRTAIESVRLAIKLNPYCGGPVRWMRLDRKA
ncbi:MAG: hypothetical protein KAY22_16975 [Rhizorhabdus sp.]|uniref:hypothetical protein n=1 Tax=Rhizorhabdus sp. TaxID=1968843 RepID=UPI001B409F5D|nr:hypothetical protein [Rhizorhabdus sp.]MBP8233993.1 hypothetical protein [Rhizorhabdus sp.]